MTGFNFLFGFLKHLPVKNKTNTYLKVFLSSCNKGSRLIQENDSFGDIQFVSDCIGFDKHFLLNFYTKSPVEKNPSYQLSHCNILQQTNQRNLTKLKRELISQFH